MHFSFTKRTFLRFIVKIVQQEGTPESIGRGAFIGLATGLILPVGLQTLPALFLAFVFKSNKALTWLFTCITNPVSMFFIYPIQCYVGSLIIFHPLTFHGLEHKFNNLLQADGIVGISKAFIGLGSEILIPFFVGGILFAAILAPLGYWFCFRLVTFYRKKKEERKRKKASKK